jgi:hypothetical protein
MFLKKLKTKLIGQHNGRKTPIHEILYLHEKQYEKKSQIKRPIFLPSLTSQSLREVSFYYRVGRLGHWCWFHHHLKGNLA